MEKIKILAIILSIFLLMGATSCQTTGGSKTTKEAVYTGKEGLTLKFIDGMPPKNVWKDTGFDIGIDVQNKGLVDVKNGKICFSSFSENVFGKPDGCEDLGELKGKLNFPDGEIKNYIWEGYELKQSYREDNEYPLTANVCYSEESRASPVICIKTISYERESVCEAGEIKLENAGNGQGAPVAVTSVYEDVIPKKGEGVELRFSITVSNIGDGEVIDLDKLNKDNCNFGRLDKNKIKIVAALTGYEPLSCGNNGVVNLGSDGKEGTIVCKSSVIKLEEGESYPLPLNIKLNYGYLSSISSKFTIKKDVEEEEK